MESWLSNALLTWYPIEWVTVAEALQDILRAFIEPILKAIMKTFPSILPSESTRPLIPVVVLASCGGIVTKIQVYGLEKVLRHHTYRICHQDFNVLQLRSATKCLDQQFQRSTCFCSSRR